MSKTYEYSITCVSGNEMVCEGENIKEQRRKELKNYFIREKLQPWIPQTKKVFVYTIKFIRRRVNFGIFLVCHSNVRPPLLYSYRFDVAYTYLLEGNFQSLELFFEYMYGHARSKVSNFAPHLVTVSINKLKFAKV